MKKKELKNHLFVWLLCCFTASIMACSSDDDSTPDGQPSPDESHLPVGIMSRTDTPSQDSQILAGLYMVNYQDGQSAALLSSANYVNNLLMEWSDNCWTTSTPIYWNDMDTKADFYAYGPYQADIANARQVDCSIQTDQTTEAAFVGSDFIWGKVEGKSSRDGDFNLNLTHVLSQIIVTVTAEAGFDDNELQANDVTVAFGGSKTNGNIDLATGELTVSGSANDVKCLSGGDLTYKAILLPQLIPFSNLIQVNWKGNLYTLQQSFVLESGRQYNLTVRLKKTKSGFDVGIAGWDIVEEDFGGVIGGN